MCEYSIRNERLTELVHTEKASRRHSEKTTVVENSNKSGIHHAILLNNGFSSENFLSNTFCSYFPYICLSQGKQIILQWQYISNSNDFLLHTFTGSINMPLMTRKSSNLFFSTASIAWFRIKDCLKVTFIGYFL